MCFEQQTVCYTAEDLFQFLSKVPAQLREHMGIQVLADDDEESGQVTVCAYSTYETEGCLEQGLQIYSNLD